MDSSSKFPVSSFQRAASMADQNLALDGQRVLFDKKVRLVPADLHPNHLKQP